MNTVENWYHTGVALHILDLGGNSIDTTSAAGRFMLVVLAGAAGIERNLCRERTKCALAVTKPNGQRVGTIPYGFDPDEDGVTLVENVNEQVAIEEINEMRAGGGKLREIADELTRRRVPTKTGNRRWTHQAIARIVGRA